MFEKEIRVEVKKGSVAVGSLKPGDIFMHKQNIYHLAAEYSHECLEVLLRVRQENLYYSEELSLKRGDFLRKTPLHLAASNVSSESARIILQFTQSAKSLLALKDGEGNTPLHDVSKFGTEETLLLLMSFAENSDKILNSVNKEGMTPIFYARSPKMVFILSKEPKIDKFRMRRDLQCSEKNETVLETMVKNNSECARTFLTSGIETNNKPLNDRDLLLIYDLNLVTKLDDSRQVRQTFHKDNKPMLQYLVLCRMKISK